MADRRCGLPDRHTDDLRPPGRRLQVAPEAGVPYAYYAHGWPFRVAFDTSPHHFADLVVSTLLFPLACAAFHPSRVANPHVDPAFLALRQTYGQRVEAIQFRTAPLLANDVEVGSRGHRAGGMTPGRSSAPRKAGSLSRTPVRNQPSSVVGLLLAAARGH